MKFFVVFQNKTFEKECAGDFLWAPKRSRNNRSLFHWTNMTLVHPGDIIFSIVKNRVISFDSALSFAFDSEIPDNLPKNEWHHLGWMVKAKYVLVENEIKIKEIIDELFPLLDDPKPFRENGCGNQGYLYQIPREAGEYLSRIVKTKK